MIFADSKYYKDRQIEFDFSEFCIVSVMKMQLTQDEVNVKFEGLDPQLDVKFQFI